MKGWKRDVECHLVGMSRYDAADVGLKRGMKLHHLAWRTCVISCSTCIFSSSTLRTSRSTLRTVIRYEQSGR